MSNSSIIKDSEIVGMIHGLFGYVYVAKFLQRLMAELDPATVLSTCDALYILLSPGDILKCLGVLKREGWQPMRA